MLSAARRLESVLPNTLYFYGTVEAANTTDSSDEANIRPLLGVPTK